ncbi:polysaccharide deacetylase family protein [Arthrobacter sp. Rue61a]|uniref:Polysaccharide deacetylase domain protein n=1 Tax=Paenarthrobacter aurescens (strain TC1) TaxID=290340 RepID=A1R6E9_PAEAT|nr:MULTISPECIES: polysaccharide deacetylase family protein [Micrococcaceae]ABM08986.1 putative polysaccharide deacetylase domain protein [Paenarthrobacter aurescens TC1]AFR29125.1 putative polysaccharide deacetylase [Arthrobacter sp. Rue61a]
MGDSKRRPLAGRRSVLLGMAGLASAALAACADGGSAIPRAASNATPSGAPRTGPAIAPPSIAARSSEQAAAALAPAATATPKARPDKQQIVAEFAGRHPKEWGLHVTGVVNKSQSHKVALTFDACGGPGGTACDHKLLQTLRKLSVPATLFINSRWIHANPSLSAELAADPLFELANHGTAHLPLSVNGKSAYGIHGTASVAAAYDELMGNQAILQEIGGKVPQFFRPGTAFYDDVAVEVTRRLGMIPVNFTVNGDGGATYSAATVAAEVGRVVPGDIVISHFNRPAAGTADGYARALPRLLDHGVSFARLGDVLTL